MPKSQELSALADSIRVCTKCRLYKNRINAVPGEGNPNSPIVFVGEAPGKQENIDGRPFVGAAGKLLNELLASQGWQRTDVFITNIVKDQPPGNRDPLLDEISICTNAWLTAQLAIIKPKIIVPLGRHAMQYFLPNVGTISQIHGQAFRRQDGRIYVPLYHPAVALYRSELRSTLEADFRILPKLLKQISNSPHGEKKGKNDS